MSNQTFGLAAFSSCPSTGSFVFGADGLSIRVWGVSLVLSFSLSLFFFLSLSLSLWCTCAGVSSWMTQSFVIEVEFQGLLCWLLSLVGIGVVGAVLVTLCSCCTADVG